MKLCPPDICTGCGACEAVCPVNCISMKADENGTLLPGIGPSCIECGSCVNVCPSINPPEFHEAVSCYAAWNSDSLERRHSASGGIAALLARLFEGRVYSTAWNEHFEAVVKNGNADEFKGSKYVQSRISKETFQEIRARLHDGEKLLFIGTPCQVAAVRNFVGKDGTHLLTADLLCHGVCPESYFKEELDRIRKGHHISNVRFRGNDAYDFHLSLWDGNNCIYDKPAPRQPYLRAFLEGVSLRENCYNCPYAKPQRAGDITLGDFIVIPGQKSMVTANSLKAAITLENLKHKYPELRAEEHPYSERFSYRPSILEPTAKSPLRDVFLKHYRRKGFPAAVRSALRNELIKAALTDLYRKVHHIGHIIKKSITSLICLAIFFSCTPALRSGDLLFVGIPAEYSLDDDSMGSGIAESTGEGAVNYIHTAILEVEGDSVWVIDATIKRGVARYPLDSFLCDFTLKDGSLPRLEVMRIKKGPADLVDNAKRLIGEPYDVHFLPDNGARYCTELVRDSYLDSHGSPIFPAAPMNFLAPDGTMPLYWEQLFARLGEEVPQGVPGTNPQDMRKSPLLKPVKIDIACLK